MPGLLPDYPAPPGNKNRVVVTIAGPASYTAVTAGTPPTGGQLLRASDVGLTAFDFVWGIASDDGQYEVVPIFAGNPQRSLPTVILLWKVAATGAQVAGAVNLSARTVRICAFG